MHTRKIGQVTVGAIGLGGMPMSIEGRPDEGRSIRTIHAALDAGVTLIDTADAYHLHAGETGHNERLIAKALRQLRRRRQRRARRHQGRPPAARRRLVDRRRLPRAPAAAGAASLKALGVDAIGLYQFHRPDPKVPYAESIGALRRSCSTPGRSGWPASPTPTSSRSTSRAGARRRQPGQRAEPVLARVPLQRGELRALRRARHRVPAVEPARRHRPGRTLGAQHAAFQEVADARGVSPQQVTLAWMLAKAPVVIPIPGASRPESIIDSAQASDLVLAAAELDRLDRA